MEARSLFAVVALIFLLWMIRTWIKWDLQSRRARKSREQLRSRLSNSAFVERVRPAVQVAHPSQDRIAAQHAQGQSADNDREEIRRLEARLAQMHKELEHSRTQLSQLSLQNSSARRGELKLGTTVDKLTAQLKAQEQQIQRQVHAVEQMDKLKKQLFDKHRELEQIKQTNARTEETLIQFRSGAQKAALLEQKLSSQLLHNERLDNELARLRNEIRNRDSKIQQLQKNPASAKVRNDETGVNVATVTARKEKLRLAVKEVEAAAAQAGQSDLELRRLKSELEALSVDSPDSSKRIADMQQRLHELRSALSEQNSTTPQGELPLTGQPDSLHEGRTEPLYKAPDYQDDLKKIKGIGPVMERTLNELGVTTFAQLANFDQQDIDRVSAAIDAFPGRIQRDDWVGKAKLQQRQKYGESA